MFVDDPNFPKNMKNDPTTTIFQGRIYVFDPKRSIVADKTGAELKGEYAIKIR
ncbi:MAG: DNA-directed RNA polymerase subunit E'' [Candidatus Woesearchaeota archaeon]